MIVAPLVRLPGMWDPHIQMVKQKKAVKKSEFGEQKLAKNMFELGRMFSFT